MCILAKAAAVKLKLFGILLKAIVAGLEHNTGYWSTLDFNFRSHNAGGWVGQAAGKARLLATNRYNQFSRLNNPVALGVISNQLLRSDGQSDFLLFAGPEEKALVTSQPAERIDRRSRIRAAEINLDHFFTIALACIFDFNRDG